MKSSKLKGGRSWSVSPPAAVRVEKVDGAPVRALLEARVSIVLRLAAAEAATPALALGAVALAVVSGAVLLC